MSAYGFYSTSGLFFILKNVLMCFLQVNQGSTDSQSSSAKWSSLTTYFSRIIWWICSKPCPNFEKNFMKKKLNPNWVNVIANQENQFWFKSSNSLKKVLRERFRLLRSELKSWQLNCTYWNTILKFNDEYFIWITALQRHPILVIWWRTRAILIF